MFRISVILVLFLAIAGCAQADKEEVEDMSSAEDSFAEEGVEETADEMLSSFSVSGYTKDGEKQWDLEGKSADIMSEEIMLTDVTGKVYGKEIDMTIVADEGSLNRIDNNVHLEKNVKATTEDGATMITDYLDWDAQNEKLASDAPVWIKRGKMEAFGTGIVGKPTLNFVELKKDVTVKISLEKENSSPKDNKDSEDVQVGQADEPALPTIITCDGPLEVEYENNLAIFYDNVKVNDSRGEIFADKMDVYFATEGESGKKLDGMEGMGIEKIIATGNVEIHHGANITYSQKAVYDTATGKLTLTGQPKLVIYSTEDFSQLMKSENKKEQEQDISQ